MAESETDSISPSATGDLPDRSSHNATETLTSLKLEYYDMSNEKKMIIFNHYDYEKNYPGFREKPEIRLGTNHDVEALENTFRALDFDVTTHHDKTRDEILDILKAMCDHSKNKAMSCVCVCVLTHGWSGGLLCAQDKMYNLSELITMLQDHAPGLVGKPKLVMVQACRGELTDPGRRVDGPTSAERLPTHVDTLVLTSSVEDFRSFRNRYNGSWLIQELCRVVNGRRDLDVLQMTTLVTSLVARDHVSHTPGEPITHNMKQTPELRSTFTKLLRFGSHSTV